MRRLNKEELDYFDKIKRCVRETLRNNKLLYFADFKFRVIRYNRYNPQGSPEGFFGTDEKGKSYIGIKNKVIINSYEDYCLAKRFGDKYDLEVITTEVKRILFHEVGHYLVHNYKIDVDNIELPIEGKTKYAYVSKEEDFAEAFADYMIRNGYTVERNKYIEEVLKKYN